MKFGSFVLVSLLLVSVIATAQIETGTPPYGSFSGSSVDTVNTGSLNVHIDIPLFQKAGRGLPINYVLSYDSSIWNRVTSSGVTSWVPVSNYGWRTWSEVETGYLEGIGTLTRCPGTTISQGLFSFRATYRYHDPSGTSHGMTGYSLDNSDCGGTSHNADGTSTDGSGYSYHVGVVSDGTQWVRTRSGTTIDLVGHTVTDRNGNRVSINGSSGSTVFTDTLGNSALTVSPQTNNPVTLAYTNPQNSTSYISVHYTSYTIQTNFSCGTVQNASPRSVSLPDKVTLPDGSYYQFTYEPTAGVNNAYTGRIASVRLPTGGTISYQYSGGGGGISCLDGSAVTVTRTTPDGTWTYARDLAGKTTVTDPSGNQTAINFTQTGGNFYETSRLENQGASNLQRTVQTCYNGAAAPCDGVAVTTPITERTVTTQLSGMSSASKVDTFYNSYGLVTENDEYKFGASTPARKTVTTYASLGNILDLPSSVVVNDGSNNPQAQTTYTYDEYQPVATSGTPQLVSVSGSRGNTTTISRWAQGSTWVTQHFYYYDTGNLQKARDPNSNDTTFTYGACGNSFLTSVARPLSLSTSMDWNCSGGVPEYTTDENGRTTNYTYGDPNLWRVTQIGYPDGGQKTFSYGTGASTPWTIGTTTKLNSTQSVTTSTVLDGLGRTNQSQLTSDPDGTSKVDSAFSFNGTGFLQTVSNPYRSTSESTYGTSSTQYDALGRVSQINRQDGNTSQMSYSGNWITTTDETNRKRKFECNGFGLTIAVQEPDANNGHLSLWRWLLRKSFSALFQNRCSRDHDDVPLRRS